VQGEYGPQERATLRGPSGLIGRVQDERAGLQWCRDVTGDGVPEALLFTYSGGAHCCTEHTLYTLSTPPRELLHAYSGNVAELVPAQLDGRGPLELLSYDNRFAYAYGLCFACSPFLPVVYALRDGLYVDDSRSFPGLISARTAVTGAPAEPADL
ncbi:hypothetical protein, partial [Deinococcus pimensis]|uniref:hypothetical protein n=1 Tax=Deinococcus pimensis TaxID=309888 RepID=UPI0005EB2999